MTTNIGTSVPVFSDPKPPSEIKLKHAFSRIDIIIYHIYIYDYICIVKNYPLHSILQNLAFTIENSHDLAQS